jgi:hypothetical protein
VRIVYNTMVLIVADVKKISEPRPEAVCVLSQLATGPPAVTFGRPESGTLSARQTGRALATSNGWSIAVLLLSCCLHLSVPAESRLIQELCRLPGFDPGTTPEY